LFNVHIRLLRENVSETIINSTAGRLNFLFRRIPFHLKFVHFDLKLCGALLDISQFLLFPFRSCHIRLNEPGKTRPR
jgi:hypothetical protein